MNALDVNDTIAAVASASGSGFRGIVRISGPDTLRCLDAIFVSKNLSPRQQSTVSAINGRVSLSAELSLPCHLLWWPTQQSYTRQPTAEIHTVCSQPLLQMLLTTICQSGARLAQPGEFTMRAFLSGRIDLTQAEAVLAVIDADGQSQFDTALQQLAGGLAGPLGDIRQQLISTLAELEAGLDFVEEDIEFISQDVLVQHLETTDQQLREIADQILRRDVVGNATRVVLSGMPNSGKSSLFNTLTRTQSAIVTDIAGTTTDFISAHLEINSAPIELIDTAGVESHIEPVSQQAQLQRHQQIDQAQLVLLCIDGLDALTEWELKELSSTAPMIVALTKSDLIDDRELPLQNIKSAGFHGPVVYTSSILADGADDLRRQISTMILESHSSIPPIVGSTIIRASESIKEANESVRLALDAAQRQIGNEIVAAEIRQSLESLGLVVGAVYTDDILDLVFGRFCIGK